MLDDAFSPAIRWLYLIMSLVASSCLTYWNKAPEALRGAAIGAVVLMVADTILGVTLSIHKGGGLVDAFRDLVVRTLTYMGIALAAFGMDSVFRSGEFAQILVMLMIFLAEVTRVMDKSAKLGVKWPKVVIDKCMAIQDVVDGGTPVASTHTEGGKRNGVVSTYFGSCRDGDGGCSGVGVGMEGDSVPGAASGECPRQQGQGPGDGSGKSG